MLTKRYKAIPIWHLYQNLRLLQFIYILLSYLWWQMTRLHLELTSIVRKWTPPFNLNSNRDVISIETNYMYLICILKRQTNYLSDIVKHCYYHSYHSLFDLIRLIWHWQPLKCMHFKITRQKDIHITCYESYLFKYVVKWKFFNHKNDFHVRILSCYLIQIECDNKQFILL